MTRTKQALYWAGPSLLCVALYWYGLRAWFQMDDFAWLALHMRMHDWRSFLEETFRPYAQGTIRPWSERLFFTFGYWIFGMDAKPFRAIVFGTQFLNLGLITALVRRLTGSDLAGFMAPVLWLCSSCIYQPLSWTAAYNQVLCAFFLLLAFYLFVRYVDTGDRKFYWSQIIVFVVGFGALELNVIYPALALCYALCCARPYLKSTLPLFLVSGLYTLVHRLVSRRDETQTYAMAWDSSIFESLWTYCQWTLGAARLALEKGMNTLPFHLAAAVIGVAVIGFVAYQLRQRRYLVMFFVAWFFIALAPYLPLHNHVTDYYLTIPAIGLCMLGGWAFAEAWRRGTSGRAAASCLLLLYAVPSAWAAREYTYRNYFASYRVKAFVQQLAYAHRVHPGKTLIVRGVDSDLFWTGFYDRPFQIFGLEQVYMTADTEAHVVQVPHKLISHHFLPEVLADRLIRNNEAVVYQLAGNRMRNITGLYGWLLSRSNNFQQPRLVRVASPLYEGQLGAGWYPIEDGFRWMSKKGVLHTRGPAKRQGTLTVTGSCVPEQVESQPLLLTATVNGHRYSPSTIDKENLNFRFDYPLDAALTGKPEIEVSLEVDRTISTALDQRAFGLIVSTVEVRP